MSRRRVKRLQHQLDGLLALVDEMVDALTFAHDQANRDVATLQRASRVISALCHELPDATVAGILDRLQREERALAAMPPPWCRVLEGWRRH